MEDRNEIKMIESAVEEIVEMKFYAKRNGVNQYIVTSIDFEPVSEEYALLIHIDTSIPSMAPPSGTVLVNKCENGELYFGKIEVYYCKREKGLFKQEKLKTINSYKQIYSKEEWNNKKNRISLRRIMNS